MREGGSSRVKEPLVEIEEEEEEMDSHVRVRAMASSCVRSRPRKQVHESREESQENHKQELGIEVVPTKIESQDAKEDKGT